MRNLFVFAMLCWGFFSCNKNNTNPYPLSGTYVGTFHRTGDTAAPAHVQIIFYEDSFSGTSDRAFFYPAICHGTYMVFGDSIAVQNLCVFTANFDWSFIFGGNFAFNMQADSIYITRNYGDFAYMPDVYALKKQ
jgi:hypothetical protein